MVNIREFRLKVTGIKQQEDIIIEQIKAHKSIVYGRRAFNAQIPGFLITPTRDWDIYAKNPRMSAYNLKSRLSKELGKSYEVIPAKHYGTWRVLMSNGHKSGDKRTIADFTKMPDKIKIIKKEGIPYEHISSIEKRKKELIHLPTAIYRRAKDKYDLKKLDLAKKMWRTK